LQFDLWERTPKSGRWDWGALKARIADHGLRNSLLVAPMPTASTAQILGNNESFEPYTQVLYVRRVLSGEFVQVNRHLLRDLFKRMQLIAHNGSVQYLDLPADLKELYKTVWGVKQRTVLDMAAHRGAYIDQSQSLNFHMTDCTIAKLSSMHFHVWQSTAASDESLSGPDVKDENAELENVLKWGSVYDEMHKETGASISEQDPILN
jgi:ribonucleotide reductase alpha subunit